MNKFPRRKSTWLLVSLVVVFGLLAGSFGCATRAPAPTSAPAPTPTPKPKLTPIVIKAASRGAPTFYGRVIIERALDIIREKAGDRVKIEYYVDLFDIEKTFRGLQEQAIHIGSTSPSRFPAEMGVFSVLVVMPWFYDTEKWVKNWRKPGGPFDFQQEYWKKNRLFLLTEHHQPYYEVVSRKPVRSIEDWKGLLVRASGAMSVVLKALGASPVTMSEAEVFTALQAGTVDANTTSLSVARGSRLYEVAPYILLNKMADAQTSATASDEWLNSLPADLKKIVIEAFIKAEAEHHARMWDNLNEDLAYMESKGAKVIRASEELMQKYRLLRPAVLDTIVKQFGSEAANFFKVCEQADVLQ